jgi:excisionase family DNA binding protein
MFYQSKTGLHDWDALSAEADTSDWAAAFPKPDAQPTHKTPMLTVAEAAPILRRTEATIRDYLRSGVLVGSRVGKAWLIPEHAVDGLLLKQMSSGTAASNCD